MVEVGQSYEMVRNFNNFKAFVMFAVKNWKPCLPWSKKFQYAYVSPENFFLSMFMLVGKFFLTMLMLVRKIFSPSPPPIDNIFGKNCMTWSKS